jgi:hypothetical protein
MPVTVEHETTQNEFKHLKVTPGTTETVTLKDIQGYHEGLDSLGNNIARFRFNGKNLAANYLPLEANPREPGSSTAVTRMRQTLENEAENFHLKNNGLTVFATGVSHDPVKAETTLQFDKENQGICNGGHTYFAVSTALSAGKVKKNTDFYLNCEVIVHPTMTSDEYKRATVDISRARNTNSQLKEFSMADQLGFFDPLKEILGANTDMISWHENDSSAREGAVPVRELLRYLACLSPDVFSHSAIKSPTGSHMPASTGSKAKIWDPWFNSCELGKPPTLGTMYPMVGEILFIKEYIAEVILNRPFTSFRKTNLWQDYLDAGESKRSNLFDPKTEVVDMGVTVEIMILGLLRDIVCRIKNKTGRTTMMGWFIPPKALIEEKIDETMTNLAHVYSKTNDSKAFVRDDSAYGHRMLKWDRTFGFAPPPPRVLIDLETKNRYELDDAGGADHILDLVSGKMTNIIPSGESATYKLT